MSTMDTSGEQQNAPVAPEPPLPIYFEARAELAARFLSGEGLEIGPLHQPLALPPAANVRYVDRMTTPDLRREYPELADWDLTEVDIVDDGERLLNVPEDSQDFIVANHFLEHCENPIGTIGTHLSKLKPGGVLYYAVPDKRFTFDFRRPVTPLEHMVADYEIDPEASRSGHYDEWVRLVSGEESTSDDGQAPSEEWIAERARQLEDASYSIHFHVWTEIEFLQLILACHQRFGGFDLEAAARRGIEFIVILRKAGPLPPPAHLPSPAVASPTPPQPAGISELDRWRSRLSKAWGVIRNDVQRWRERK